MIKGSSRNKVGSSLKSQDDDCPCINQASDINKGTAMSVYFCIRVLLQQAAMIQWQHNDCSSFSRLASPVRYRLFLILLHGVKDMDSDSSSTDTEEFEAQRRIDQRITFRPRPSSNGSSRIQISSRPSSIDSRATGSLLRQQQQQQQPVLFDGSHTPRNIAAISFLLGLGGGIGVAAAWLSSTPQMGLFLLAVALFHFADYLATSMYQVHKLNLEGNMIWWWWMTC